MKRSTIIQDEIVVFGADAARYPAIDRSQVNLYLDRLFDCRRQPRLDVAHLHGAEPLGLPSGVTPELEWMPKAGFPFLSWCHDGVTFNQRLGGYGGRRASNKVSATVVFNPIAEAARMLCDTAKRDAKGLRRSAKHNFVHPATMTSRELHERTVEIAFAFVERARAEYAMVLQRLFGIQVDATDVQVSVAGIEFAWDAYCRIPALALRAMHVPWLRGMPDGRVVTRGSSDVPVNWERSVWSNCTLRAQYAQGHSAKVYASSRESLRYEQQIYANGQDRLLGHRVRLNNIHLFRADVQQFGRLAYAPILQVQRELTQTTMMPIAYALCAGIDPRRRPFFIEIVDALMATGRVFARSRSHYAALCAMREAGCVEATKPKGYWEATPEYHLALASFQRFAEVFGS